MAKPVKSQWDFGELFPPEARQAQRKVLSVSELTWQIRRLLEDQVGQVWVTGEITNLREQSSGHIYFSLKDASAQLSCVLFRGETGPDRSLLQDGRKVTLQGELTVYEPRGQYQLRVTAVELEGVGALQAAFEKLKQKLKAEGLFAPERKRPLPKYPMRIGLVTSPTGAAIRDVLHVVQRRNPSLEIILAACRVQGEGAAEEIAAAIRLLNEFNECRSRSRMAGEALIKGGVRSAECGVVSQSLSRHAGSAPTGSYLDLILVTRGGGSLEDLWAFNEEVVARAIFDSALPVVSAVGHEIDFTISDFVADLRAATPSVAAEIITEGIFSCAEFLGEAGGRIKQMALQQLDDKASALAQTAQRLDRFHPRRRLNDWLQRLDDLQGTIIRCGRQGTARHRLAWQNLRDRLTRVRPDALLRRRREVLLLTWGRLQERARHHLEHCLSRADSSAIRLRLLGPDQVLQRGYSSTSEAETGKVLRDANEVRAGQRLRTRLKTGEVLSRVEKAHNQRGN